MSNTHLVGGWDRRSTEEILVIKVSCGIVLAATNLVAPSNAETLAWRNGLVFQAVWYATVKNTDAFHYEQLCKVSIKDIVMMSVRMPHVMRSVTVVVNTSEECCRCVSANVLG